MLAVLLLGVGLNVLKVASTLIWWLIMIPLLGSILGLAISYLIKRVILPGEVRIGKPGHHYRGIRYRLVAGSAFLL